MGRKIPGKKHRGVKNPFEQNARRNAALLRKVDSAPANPDEQDIPRSVVRIMQLKQAVKDGSFKKKGRKREGNVAMPGMTRPERPTPVFERQPGETNKHFMQRVDAECQEVLAEAKFEKEFGVAVQRDPETGVVTGVARQEKIELDRIMEKYSRKEGKQERRRGKKKGTEERPSKKERWKLRKKEKLLKSKQKEVDEFERFRDDVKFGEVVHAPPVLNAPRRAAPSGETVSRPGKKTLLLTSLLGPAAAKPSSAEKQRRERQRLSVVEAYRQLKAQQRLPRPV